MRYGVWVVLAIVALAWEIIAVKTFRKRLGLPPRDHPTISELVWTFERRFGLGGQIVVGALMLDLAVHFVAHTPLLPLP